MSTAFVGALARLAPIGAAAREALLSCAVRRSFAAGEYLLQAGERAEWTFFVERGLVRELYVDEAGQEVTRVFVPEGQTTGSLLDLLSDEPSVTFIQALEPTETVALRYRDFDALTARFGELQLLARRIAEALYVRKARREHEMLALPAAERYARFVAEHPALDARISRRQLASYLGVTPEHLSRLLRGRTRARSATARRRRS